MKRTATIGADVAAPVADLGLEAGEAGEAVLGLGLDMVPYKTETLTNDGRVLSKRDNGFWKEERCPSDFKTGDRLR